MAFQLITIDTYGSSCTLANSSATLRLAHFSVLPSATHPGRTDSSAASLPSTMNRSASRLGPRAKSCYTPGISSVRRPIPRAVLYTISPHSVDKAWRGDGRSGTLAATSADRSDLESRRTSSLSLRHVIRKTSDPVPNARRPRTVRRPNITTGQREGDPRFGIASLVLVLCSRPGARMPDLETCYSVLRCSRSRGR